MDKMHERIAKARNHLGLTQAKFGGFVGMEQKDVSRLEKGLIKNIPHELILFLYNRGISIEYLYGVSEIMLIESNEVREPSALYKVKETSNTEEITPGLLKHFDKQIDIQVNMNLRVLDLNKDLSTIIVNLTNSKATVSNIEEDPSKAASKTG